MRPLNRWLSRLQLSPRSQRVLTEAALDWRHEVATAKTMAARLSSHARASLGFSRACLSVLADALTISFGPTWLLRVVVAMAAVSALNWERLTRLTASSHGDPVSLVIAIWPQLVNTMPYALGIAVLIGPRRSPSPVLGMAVFAALSSWAFAWYWRLLVIEQWLAAGRRLDPGSAIIPSSFMWFTIAFTVGLVLLADRVRVAERRVLVTLVSLAQLALVVLAIGPLSSGLRAVGVPGSLGRAAVMAMITAAPLLIWLRLLRRQERQQQAPA